MPLYTDFQALDLGHLQTEVLQLLWIKANEDSNGYSPDASFIKYSKYRVNHAINQAYMELAFAGKAMTQWFILPLTANYTQYPVPSGIFDIEKVYYFTSATAYSELEVKELAAIDKKLGTGWLSYPGTPTYAYVGDRAGMRIKLGVAPAPSASATAITVGTGGDTASRPFGGVDAVTGSADALSATVNYVDASGQDFDALGLIAGLTIYNITTDDSGTIVSIGTTSNPNDTIVCSGVTWTAGDVMRVLGGEITSTISIGAAEATYILVPTAGSIPTPLLTMAAGNLLVRGYTLPVKLSSIYQFPELNPYFHQAIAYGAAAFLGLKEPTESLEYTQATAHQTMFATAKLELSAFVASQYKVEPKITSRRTR